jgi:acyl carrier protein
MDITKQVIERVAEYKEVAADTITVNTTIEELEMDSLDALNLIFELEEEFDLAIPDDDAFEMKTIGEMATGIEKLVKAKKKETETATGTELNDDE